MAPKDNTVKDTIKDKKGGARPGAGGKKKEPDSETADGRGAQIVYWDATALCSRAEWYIE